MGSHDHRDAGGARGSSGYTSPVRRLGIDTHQEPVLYMHVDCPICRSEGFEAQARVLLRLGERSVIATLNVVRSELIEPGVAGLSESAWQLLNAEEGCEVSISHPRPLDSLRSLRGKILGRPLGEPEMRAIVEDVARGRYSDVHLAAFLTACAGDRMALDEVIGLARAMVAVGERLAWKGAPIVDKHCVGGLPGNRTTPLVVAIATACGLIMPKTSSRAITSPAGTADTMETLAPVDLGLDEMRRVVEREGGCVVWGGAVRLSPADDVLIRVERVLDLDSEGQMVASVLSKKAAAGSTQVVLDVPVGPTAKVRTSEAAARLGRLLRATASELGLEARVIETDGTQPVGRGIGPALEARDVVSVLRCEPSGPRDLRERALLLSGALLELAGSAPEGSGRALAERTLDSGAAWSKLVAICEAQGGMREPPVAPRLLPVESERDGIVEGIDNRRLARVAKLAGAPEAKAAGLELHARVGDSIVRGQPLFTIHAETEGELDYSRSFVEEHPDIVAVGPPQGESP